jgi:small-conductance mechanosensitive channel
MILDKVLYGNVTVFDLALAIFILVAAGTGGRLLSAYLKRVLREKVDPEQLAIILKVVSYGILILALLVVLPTLGLRLSGVLVAGGVAGVAIGFASQSILGNLISGIFLIIERPIKIGNSVNIEGTVGIVEDIRIMSTTLRTFDGFYVRIPNQKVFTTNITNYVANVARRFEYGVGIRYTDDAERAIKVIKEVIRGEPMALMRPEPLVFVDTLGDSSVNIMVRVWAPVDEWFGLKTKLLWKIKKAIEAEGIEIPFPQRVVWFGKQEEASEAFSLDKGVHERPEDHSISQQAPDFTPGREQADP